MRAAVRRKAVSRSYTAVPPVRGWIANEPLAGSKPGGALVLENWFPTKTSVRVRGGSQKYATVSTGAVLSMFTYKSGTQEKFFAADSTKIVDISSIVDPDVIVPTDDYIVDGDGDYILDEDGNYLTTGVTSDLNVTGQTSGYYSTAQFGTAGGDYLPTVNGTDAPIYFDGAAWNTHAFTGDIGDSSALSFVWSYGSRLWFIEKNTTRVWYLPVDSINGELTLFDLAGVLQEGASLLFGGRWSLDAGNGLDDKWFVVSTTGEVAVYEGTNPSDANNWANVGIYQITEPLGFKGVSYAGGDPLIATQNGIVPLSEAISKDPAALSLAAVTKQIEPEWKAEVAQRSAMPWEIMKWPTNNMMVVSLPIASGGLDAICFVCNVETGAWCKFKGWDTQCLCLYDGWGYFGTSDGKVFQMEIGGTDDGAPYTCTYIALPDHMRSPGVAKLVHSARVTVKASFTPILKVSASIDYQQSLPSAPSSGEDFSNGGEWDVSLWDSGVWDATGTTSITSKWVSVGRTGFVVSTQVQVTCGYTLKPELEMIATDIVFETGGVFV